MSHLNTLNQLVSAFCRLKGIGELATDNSNKNQIKIEFEDWEWEVGVGLYGLYNFAKYNNDKNLINSMINWYDYQIAKGLPPMQINTTAPMLALLLITEDLQMDKYKPLLNSWADDLLQNLPKTSAGGFQHVVKEQANTEQLWDDTLFMTCLFLAKGSSVLKRDELLKEAEYQFLLHAHYLSDTKTDLWYHGWTFDGQHHFGNALWGRGNAWVTVGITDLITLLGKGMSETVSRFLVAILDRQMAGLVKYQAENGMWHTLLDDDFSPEESSATAAIAYGMLKASRMGLVKNPIYIKTALKATKAVLDCMDSDGVLLKASAGTLVGHDLQYYHDVRMTPVPYAQALAILLVVELIEGKWEI